MSITELQLYKALKDKLGENEAATLVDFVHSEVKSEIEQQKTVLATKDDLHKLDLKIEQSKVEVMRSVYIVGLVQFLAIVTAVIGILSFMLKGLS